MFQLLDCLSVKLITFKCKRIGGLNGLVAHPKEYHHWNSCYADSIMVDLKITAIIGLYTNLKFLFPLVRGEVLPSGVSVLLLTVAVSGPYPKVRDGSGGL